MPRVIFHGGNMPREIAVDYVPDGVITVLDLAHRHDIPLHWRCGLGTCGTCAVRVTVLDGELRPLQRKEQNVLVREGKPVDMQVGEAAWRLACGYVLSGETLRLEW